MKKLLLGFTILSSIMLASAIADSNQPSFASPNTLDTIQQNSRLTLSQLEDLIRNRTPDSAIAKEIRSRSIAFRVTNRILESLEGLGAGPETIKALKTYIDPEKIKAPSKTAPRVSQTKPLPTASPNTIKILVANFRGPDPQNYLVTDKIIQGLRAATNSYSDISVEPLGETITEQNGGSSYAHDIGTKRNANIVLWGYYGVPSDQVDISVYFEVLRAPRSLSLRRNLETQTLPVKDLKDFRIQTRLSGKLTYLVLLTTGLARYELRDYEGAIDRFTKALPPSEAPSDVPQQIIDPSKIYYFRGLAYYFRESADGIDQAIADFDKVIQIKSDFREAYFNRGNFYLLKRHYDHAINDYDKAIKLKPDDADAYNNRGYAFNELNQYERAIADFDKAIKLKPDDVHAYGNRGIAYRQMNRFDRAIADFDKVAKLNPNDAKAYFNRGLTYGKMNQHARALADFDKGIKLNPRDADAYLNRGIAYIRMDQCGPGVDDFDKAIELKADNAEAYFVRGTTYSEMSQHNRAIADLDKAIKLKPDHADAYLNRGIAYLRIKQFGRGIADFNKVMELRPDDAKAYTTRGAAYIMMNQYDRAIADFDKAIELKPDNADAYYNRAIFYIGRGQLDRVIVDLKAVVRLTNDANLRQLAEQKLKELGVR